MSTQFIIKFPSDLPEEGLYDPEVSEKGKQTVVMEMLRKSIISQGRAAELLEIDRYALLDLMESYDIPVIEMTSEELKAELSKPVGQFGAGQ
jgi:predicted HTH domain antitoxin